MPRRRNGLIGTLSYFTIMQRNSRREQALLSFRQSRQNSQWTFGWSPDRDRLSLTRHGGPSWSREQHQPDWDSLANKVARAINAIERADCFSQRENALDKRFPRRLDLFLCRFGFRRR